MAIEPSVTQSFTESAMEVDYMRVYQENTSPTEKVIKSASINVFPNPVADKLTLQTSFQSNSTVEIFSVCGELLNTFQSTNSDIRFDVSHLPDGVYFVKCRSGNQTNMAKFVKASE